MSNFSKQLIPSINKPKRYQNKIPHSLQFYYLLTYVLVIERCQVQCGKHFQLSHILQFISQALREDELGGKLFHGP